MAKTHREREDDKRDQRLETMRRQIASGDLTVRQMTPEERARWDEHSAASARHMAPEESARRKAALKKRARVEEMRKTPGDKPKRDA
jgi:hypothetical protein